MSEIRFNSAPVRTSENYKINDIKIEDIKLQQNRTFENIVYQDFDEENIQVTHDTSRIEETYPIGIEEQLLQNKSVSLKLKLKQNSHQENIIRFFLDEDNRQLVDDIEIIAEENCVGKFTICYAMQENENKNLEGTHLGMVRAHLEKNAHLDLTVINILGANTSHIFKMENTLEENAVLNYHVIEFGGNSSVTNYETNLVGDKSENNLNAIYLGTGNQLLDMNYITTTRGKQTKVNMDVQGALKDNAKKHFKGTIDFKRGCQKAEGSENEFCMLLSDEAKSISLPMLLCDEEDVVGNHAAAAGKVENNELFYIMSRGLTEKEAKTILVRARFNRVLKAITDEELKDKILTEINERLA